MAKSAKGRHTIFSLGPKTRNLNTHYQILNTVYSPKLQTFVIFFLSVSSKNQYEQVKLCITVTPKGCTIILFIWFLNKCKVCGMGFNKKPIKKLKLKQCNAKFNFSFLSTFVAQRKYWILHNSDRAANIFSLELIMFRHKGDELVWLKSLRVHITSWSSVS